MRHALLVIAVMTVLPASQVAAQQPRPSKSARPVPSSQQHQLKSAGAGNSCALYGAGFVRVEGTATCVRTGGAVSVGIGGGR